MKSSYTAILLLSAWFGHWRPTSLGTEKKSSKSPRSIFFGGRRTAAGRFHDIWPIRPPPDDALLGGSALPAYKEGRGSTATSSTADLPRHSCRSLRSLSPRSTRSRFRSVPSRSVG